jgi:ATP-dependent DNA ligase
LGAPVHEEAARLLKKAGVRQAVLGGELYVRRADGKRARVHDLMGAARAPQSQADVDSLAFAVFAIYDLDGAELSAKPAEALERMRALFAGGKRVHAVETVEGDEKEVIALFRKWTEEENEEGAVALSAQAGWYKIKPRHSIDLAVVGFSEGIEDRAGMLHSLLVAAVRDDGTFHLAGRVGGGYSEEERVRLLAELKEREADSSFVEVNSDKVAYRMVKPGLVMEISCLDVISITTDGLPINRMVLEWNAAASSWAGVRRLPLVSIISPQFVRLRDDKPASTDAAGLSQLTKITEIPSADVRAADAGLPSADVLRRAVASKELKGKTMVRKLLMWKTNKEEVSAEHPAYVLMLTDYSPNRKTPLEREICVSSSPEQMEEMWEAWQAEYFVKGWVAR